ncbi:unnamed protein product [Clavelina lepadiformis]|uniref:Sushi domain-containing protein n=1 Tax=Clavelina lepadiformis TaxID=159417 RepID=A0ABP0FFV7_CLALP
MEPSRSRFSRSLHDWSSLVDYRETVGAASVNSAGGTSAILNPDSIYASRIDISVGIFASDQFATTLTIRELLASEDGSTVRISYLDLVDASLQLSIKECASSLPYGVVITSSSRPYRYQASGTFSCPKGDLFYSNGTALPSGDTTCLANAKWSGQDNLQCWSGRCIHASDTKKRSHEANIMPSYNSIYRNIQQHWAVFD